MAAHWDGRYSREEFADLDGSDQARIIALYLISTQMEAIVSAEHIKEMKRRNSK